MVNDPDSIAISIAFRIVKSALCSLPFKFPIRETPREIKSTVQISFLIQWLRLNRDIAYREIGVFDVM
jgi:hypothetical protein